jgi:hypothetical protein
VAALIALTLHENNDETVVVTLTPVGDDDLSTVDAVQFVMKPDSCESDDDDDALVLTSVVPDEITITAQSAQQITAEVYVPAAALQGPYGRTWRLDALTGDLRRTALYGPVTVIDL